MDLVARVQKGWNTAVDNFKRKRYFLPSNYLSDAIAGNASRTPLYAIVDTVLVGASEERAVASAVNSFGLSLCGWSLAYIMGNSILAETLGNFYSRHKKAVDATYSAAVTFGFGMGVNLSAGYSLNQAIAASTLRAAVGIPLGPVTRYYSDSFREIRGEPSISPDGAGYRGKSLSFSMPRIAAMIALPIALMGSVLYANRAQDSQSAVPEYVRD
jgi:hypothetical protein